MSSAITEIKPSLALQAYVELYTLGCYNVQEQQLWSTRLIPSGFLEIIFHLNEQRCELPHEKGFRATPDFMIIGLMTKPTEIRFRAQVKVFSIRLRPEAFSALFGLPCAQLSMAYEDLSTVLGREFQSFAEQLREEPTPAAMVARSEHFLRKLLSRQNPDAASIEAAGRLIRQKRGLRIAELSELAGISPRQLQREFKHEIGMSPKQYLRITRINEAVRMMQGHSLSDLTALAYHCGYFDQAHFINDFKAMTGLSPSQFRRGISNLIGTPGATGYRD